jgi:hypothetical protein
VGYSKTTIGVPRDVTLKCCFPQENNTFDQAIRAWKSWFCSNNHCAYGAGFCLLCAVVPAARGDELPNTLQKIKGFVFFYLAA